MKILLVDDDLYVLRVIEQMLRTKYEHVVAVHTGVLAMSELAKSLSDQEPFDLAIIDCILPQVEGLTLVEEVFRSHLTTKVILISGYPTVVGHALHDLASKYTLKLLLKPFSYVELVDEIEKIFS